MGSIACSWPVAPARMEATTTRTIGSSCFIRSSVAHRPGAFHFPPPPRRTIAGEPGACSLHYNASMSDVTDTVRALVPVVILAAATSLGADVPRASPSHPEMRYLTDHHLAPAIEPHHERSDGPENTVITPGTGSLGIVGHAPRSSTSTARLS